MRIRRGTAAAGMVIGAMTIALGTAHAEPAPDSAQPAIDYSAKLVDKTVVTKLKGGTFALVDKAVTTPGATPDQKQQVVDIKDKAGNIAMEMPLDFRIAGVQIPLKPVLKEDGTVLELTPDRPAGVAIGTQPLVAVARPVDAPVPDATVAAPADKPVTPAPGDKPLPQAKDVASATENQRAMNDFTTKFGLATAVGGFVGTAIGAVIGCVVTIVAACVPGLVTGAGVGGIVGTIAAGGPTLLAAGLDLVGTMQAPDGTTQWADAASKSQAVSTQQPVAGTQPN